MTDRGGEKVIFLLDFLIIDTGKIWSKCVQENRHLSDIALFSNDNHS